MRLLSLTLLAVAALLFAQEGPTVLAPGAGWVGAGLLGLILSWLAFRHLPEKDAMIERLIKRSDDIIERREEMMRKAVADHAREQEEMRKVFRETLIQITGQYLATLSQITATRERPRPTEGNPT